MSCKFLYENGNKTLDLILKMIWEYRQMVETELQLIRCDILGVLDEHLIPAPNTD